MEKRLSITFGILLIIVGLFSYFRYREIPQRLDKLQIVDSGTFFIMGTTAHIKLWADDRKVGEKVLIKAVDKIRKLDHIFSYYKPDSELSKINKLAGIRPVEISAEMYYLLEQAIKYGKLTEGAFDITIVPLIELWQKASTEGKLPSAEEILKAKELVNYEYIILSKRPTLQVRFAKKNVKITLNGIAKGYIVDEAYKVCNTSGIKAGIIDIGGEIATFGKEFIIGIQDPFVGGDAPPSARWIVKLKNLSIATSGNYRRYFTINGRRYSHIIDPRTGVPADALTSVTVIAPSTLSADVLATAISVLGSRKGIELANNLPFTDIFIVEGREDNFTLHLTEGFKRYLLLPED